MRHSDAAIIEANTAAEIMYGYSREELLGLTIYDLRAPATRPMTQAQMRQAAEGGVLFLTEHRRKDGSAFPVEVSSRGVLDADGQLLLLSVVRDITERRQMEGELHRLEEEAAVFLGLDLDLMGITDAEGRVLLVNEGVRSVLGYEPDELEGRPFRESVHPDDLPKVQRASAEMAQGGEVRGLILRMQHKDGSYRWVEWRGRPHNRRLYALGRDITASVQAQEALASHIERLKALFLQSPAGIWVYDRDLLISESNERMADILGTDLEQFVGFDFKQADDQSLNEALRRAIEGEDGEYEGPYHSTLSGRDLWVSVRTSPLRAPNGTIEAGMAVLEDRTESKHLESELQTREEEIAEFFSLDLDLMAITDMEGRILRINEGARSVLGYETEELEGTVFVDLLHPDDVARVVAGMQRLGSGEEVREFVERTQHKDGTYRLTEWRARAHDGRVYALGRDITKRIEAQRTLAAQAERLHALFQQSPAGIWVCDRDLIVTESNHRIAEILGIELDQFLGSDCKTAADQGINDALRRALKGEVAEYEGLYHVTLSGRDIWVSVHTSPLRGVDGTVEAAIAVLEDRTERMKAEALVDRLSFTDALTGLPNRTLYRDRLSQAISLAERSATRLAVVALNIDRFRTISDNLGRRKADRFLQLFGERLDGCLGEPNTLARDAHDQFLAMLRNVEGEHGVGVALELLLKTARGPWRLDEHEFPASVSAGVALWPDDGSDAEELMQNANWALRKAQAAGGGAAVFFDPDTGELAKTRAELEAELRRALQADEFVVHYQPQVDMESGKVKGFEALVRWQHPERGLVPPFDFIPVAEECGLIADLDRLVLRHACRDVGSVSRDLGHPVRLAVNVSAAHLRQPDAADAISAIAADAGFDVSQLEVEVTETAILEDIASAERSLRELRALGATIALDDFGTGYSSLSHLHQLPIQRLKIDRSFVMNLPEDGDAGVIATSVVALAHALHYGVVAEGVETEAQVRFLLDAGCTTGQGYFFGRPLPIAEWEERAKDAGRGCLLLP